MLIYSLFLSQIILAAAATAPAASTPDEVLLWPEGAPGSEGKTGGETVVPRDDTIRRIAGIHKPSLTVHLPAKDVATGAAVIIMPGGGHRYLSIDNEGNEIARWLAQRGVAGLVLKYRLAREEGSTYTVEKHAFADAVRAMRVARLRARDWGLDPERIGMMGLSAGGQLLFHAATRFDSGQGDAADPVERQASRPAFAAFVYSGSAPDGAEVPKNAPPAFLCAAFDDKGPARTAIDLFQKLRDAGGTAELHVYGQGGHGFGMKNRPLAITGWIDRFHDWMADQGFLKPLAPIT
jgi:endo-1,4-beta-xylanase